MGVLTNINYNTNMEITPEIKAKVFAQYLGQKCTTPHGWTTIDCVRFDGINLTHEDPIYFDEFDTKLVLRPLSAIADEDAIEVATIFLGNPRCSNESGVNIGKNVINQIFVKNHIGFSSTQIIQIYQFLTNAGYDIPQYLLGWETLFESHLCLYENMIPKK